jgi:hypothetical protein
LYSDVLADIEQLYSQYKLPVINGIITKDDFIKISFKDIVFCERLRGVTPSANKRRYFDGKLEFIRSVFDDNTLLREEECSDIDIIKKTEHEDYVLHCGEGSYGGDGFIMITDKNDKIRWLLFHERINPIEKVEIENNRIIGINNCNKKYEFNIDWEKL